MLTRLSIVSLRSYSTNARSVTREIIKENKKKTKIRTYYPVKSSRNPGIEKLAYLRHTEDKKADLDDLEPEELHEEGDFMDAYNMLDEHEKEVNTRRNKYTVQRKFFEVPKQANLLTWAEKEQIRLLHQLDPKEWCPERLAQSFPVSVYGVKRVLRANWKPNRVDFAQKHDKAVIENWKKIAEGEIQLTPELKHLIGKANNRSFIPNPQTTFNVPPASEPPLLLDSKHGEFKNLVYDPKKHLESNVSKSQTQSSSLLTENNAEVVPSIFLKHGVENWNQKTHFTATRMDVSDTQITLEKYKSLCLGVIQKKDADESPHRHPAPAVVEVESSEHNELDIPPKYARSDRVKLTVEAEGHKKEAYIYNNKYGYQKPLSMPQRGDEHIIIPKEKWKEGATYKVGDSFYDDKGEFLYAVPGIK